MGLSRAIKLATTQAVLSIACWNVNGLKGKSFNKLEDQTFMNELTQHDLIGLIETHMSADDKVDINGYYSVSVTRTKLRKARRHSGGITVLIKENVRPGIKIIEQSCPELVWVKLCKDFFKNEKDIYIAYTYITPANSSYTRRAVIDVFSELERGITQYAKDGHIVIMGDFNAKTAAENDFISHDDDNHIPMYDRYTPDCALSVRNNQDTHKVDEQGRRLLDLCIASGTRVLNGRTLGDLMGSLTCFKYNGSSTADYGIVEAVLLPKVKYFKVHDYLNDISDHCKLSMGLQVGRQVGQMECTGSNTIDTAVDGVKYVWAADSRDKFSSALQTQRLKDMLTAVDDHPVVQPDTLLTAINRIIHTAAEECLTRRPKRTRRVKHKSVKKKWYDIGCRDMKTSLTSIGKKLKSDPFNATVRHAFFNKKKQYRNLLNHKRREYRTEIIDKIQNIGSKDPKVVWDLLGQLKEDVLPTINKSDNVNPDTWFDHFQTLLQAPDDMSKDEDIKVQLENMKTTPVFNQLDFKITQTEI
jgi:exonuclease III